MNGSKIVAGIGLLVLCLCASAGLPPPTPEQQQAAAAKKAAAAAQAEKEKQQLSESMDRISEHWRRRAQAQGWQAHAPTPVQAAQGFKASETQSGPSGQPGGKVSPAAAQAPVRSEKLGTAPPSEDVKKPPPPQAVR